MNFIVDVRESAIVGLPQFFRPLGISGQLTGFFVKGEWSLNFERIQSPSTMTALSSPYVGHHKSPETLLSEFHATIVALLRFHRRLEPFTPTRFASFPFHL